MLYEVITVRIRIGEIGRLGRGGCLDMTVDAIGRQQGMDIGREQARIVREGLALAHYMIDRRIKLDLPAGADAGADPCLRITSYNVCYTKLLRVSAVSGMP